MLKKLGLSLAFATISIAASTESIDRISAIQTTRAHIAQEKEVVKAMAAKIAIAGAKAKKTTKAMLQEDYTQLKPLVTDVINNIITSAEFNDTINQITDLQASCIAEQGMSFDEIEIDSAHYPLDHVIDNELNKVFPQLNEPTSQLFNVLYVTLLVDMGCNILLEKLELKEQELNEKINVLEASNQVISE